MADFINQKFAHESVNLDGNAYTNCRFVKCRLLFSGGGIPLISGCEFRDCRWQFGGTAANTIAFLAGLYQGGFDRVVEETFISIRKGTMVQQDETNTKSGKKPLLHERFLKTLKVIQRPRS